MTQSLTFFVHGLPAPGGSKKGFAVFNKATGKHRSVITDDAKRNKDWKAMVAYAAGEAMQAGVCVFRGPVEVEVTFYMPRPKGHYRTGKNAGTLKDSAPKYPITKPDTTKLWRSTEDAMKSIVWLDDSQVVDQYIRRRYADNTAIGAMIEVVDMAAANPVQPKGGC